MKEERKRKDENQKKGEKGTKERKKKDENEKKD